MRAWPSLAHAAIVLAVAMPGMVPRSAGATEYYVSSSAGSDASDGLTPATAKQTVAAVNALALAAGDTVHFRCGDIWHAEVLRAERSGVSGSPITYTSYPESDCSDKPVLAGTRAVTGWTVHSGSIWRADLSASLFPEGTNQVFRDGTRLPLGRWPNLDDGDGYSQIDAQPSGTQLRDDQLPAVNWTGATAHMKCIRWAILNRTITGDTGNTLSLNASASCWTGSCAGWGWFLNGHLATLDREGEWYYDPAARRLYLFTSGDPNASSIEGSVVIDGESESMGGIILGKHLQDHISYVTFDNLEIRGWFDNGISTPVNLEANDHQYVTLRNLTIRDVDGAGINLATWVWNAQANGNGYNGWRGGNHVTIEDCLIERANEYGINSYARNSTFRRNTLRDIALIENVGRAGIGCDLDNAEPHCTEPGTGIRLKGDQDGLYSSSNVTVELNRLTGIGHNGITVYSYGAAVRRNVVEDACAAKGDCGAVGLYGSSPLGSSVVHDVTIEENVIRDISGNTDGCHTSFRALFGFGIYVDHYSRAIVSRGNTVARVTAAGILYQNSTGSVMENMLFANSPDWGSQTVLSGSGGGSNAVATHTDNVMLALTPSAGTLSMESRSLLGTSNRNGFYHASRAAHITDASTARTLAQWQSASGKDASSRERIATDLAEAQLFVNDTETALTINGAGYTDLDGNPAPSTVTIAPFRSAALIGSPLALSVQDAQTTEADSGSTAVTFTVTVAEPEVVYSRAAPRTEVQNELAR